jgi:hypothetical protein
MSTRKKLILSDPNVVVGKLSRRFHVIGSELAPFDTNESICHQSTLHQLFLVNALIGLFCERQKVKECEVFERPKTGGGLRSCVSILFLTALFTTPSKFIQSKKDVAHLGSGLTLDGRSPRLTH